MHFTLSAATLLLAASSAAARNVRFEGRANGQGQNGQQNNGGNQGQNNGGGAASTQDIGGLTLQNNLVQTGSQDDGLKDANGTEAGLAASATSNNNFINFCGEQAQQGFPLTNGVQLAQTSCNGIPMGAVINIDKSPAARFVSPKNLDTIQSNQNFTVQMAITNMNTGSFTNADTTYYAAPCAADAGGVVTGHSHIVIQPIPSLTDNSLQSVQQFSFFKGLNTAAQNGILSAEVAGGLKAGTYRMASINTCSNHAPVALSFAQHFHTDDMVYFTVADNAGGNGGNNGQQGGNNGQQAAQGQGQQAGQGQNKGQGQQAAQGQNKGQQAAQGQGQNKGQGQQGKQGKRSSFKRLNRRRLDLEASA